MAKSAKVIVEPEKEIVPGPMEHYFQDINGYFDWPQLYRDAVESIPDGGTFVEIGCWRGMSLSFFLVEAKNSGKNIKVIGIDHFRGSMGEGILQFQASTENIESECRRNAAKAGYPFEIIRCSSTEAARRFTDGTLDYVFIDGSHDYDSVIADIRAWRPKIKSIGIIAGHDINQYQVEQAVKESIGEVEVVPFSREPHWSDCWRKSK